MIINPKLRFMLRHQISFRAARGRGEPLYLVHEKQLDVFSILKKAIGNKKYTLTLKNKDIIRLTKVEINKDLGVISCLFRRSDPDATIPFFEDMPTGVLRKAEKKATEALSVSAHMFISTLAKQPFIYEAVLEEVDGVSKTYIQKIIIDILSDVEYESNDDRGRVITARTLPELVGHNHERLGGKDAGEIEFVQLVRPGSTDGLDEAGIRQHQEKMVLRIDRNAADKIGIVRRIQKWAAGKGWDKLKVQVVLPDDKSRLVAIARDADAADVLFVKAIRVDIQKELDGCSEDISEELMRHSSRIMKE